jgi:hypothetical protein
MAKQNTTKQAKKQETKTEVKLPDPFLQVDEPITPVLMNNVVNIFIHGIPADSFDQCADGGLSAQVSREDLHKSLADFVRKRLTKIATYEYGTWINGQIPFVTSRELELWRLRQFVEFMWYWNLPDDDDLALIFNYTKRKASNLASDFLARFRKTILFPVAIRRLYQMLHDEPLKDNESHPRKNWKGCIYRIEFDRQLEHLNALIAEVSEQSRKILPDACFYDRDEGLIWLPFTLRKLVLEDKALSDKLFKMYPLPGRAT